MSNDIVTDDVYDELKRDYNAKCAELAQAHERLDTLEGIEDRLRGELAGQAKVVEAARLFIAGWERFHLYQAKCAEAEQLREALEAQGDQWSTMGWHTWFCQDVPGDCQPSCQQARAALRKEDGDE